MTASLLALEHARFNYGDRAVVKDVSMQVSPHEVYCLLGPNGAGKSTLIGLISGQLRPDTGTVQLAGLSPMESSEARQLIGLVPQNIALYEKLTAKENLMVIGRLMGITGEKLEQRTSEALRRINLQERENDRVEVLSGGMRRRINIAAALIHDPRLLILDEPTVGIDHAGRRAIRDLLFHLRDRGLAILLTTHEIDEAEALADRVGVMVSGEIVAQGTPTDLVAHTFGEQFELTLRLIREPKRLRAVQQVIQQLQMTYDTTTDEWRALVVPHNPTVRSLIMQATDADFGACDFRFRRPGLNALMTRIRTILEGQ